MFDFANSGYTTVVLTAIFNAYFVDVVAGATDAVAEGTATLLWTVAVAAANALVLASAPVVGAMADHLAAKKTFLLAATASCVVGTAALALVGPGDVYLGMALVILSCAFFLTCDNLIAAFLPEIASARTMGRISGYGWSLGYFGGLLTLGLCLAYIAWARGQGAEAQDFVPVTMLIVAVVFAAAATPTFLWLRERARPAAPGARVAYVRAGFGRLRRTLAEAALFRDLFRFLITLAVFQSGVATVIVLAAIYAQQVMGFDTQELLILIMVVNVTAAVGAFLFGHVQDRLGSVRTLAITLVIWIAAILLAYLATEPWHIWVVGNLIGVAMGSSQSAGRSLVGQFTPPPRTAEFFGLWGLAGKLATVIGPISYGVIGFVTGGDHRASILSTLFFFAAGLVLLLFVDERRGQEAARAATVEG